MSVSAGSEHRYSAAYAFAEALRASGLNGEQARHRLAEALEREVPITRPTMADWLSGTTAVPMEVVIAAGHLAGLAVLINPDGSVEIFRKSPAAMELKQRAAGALRGLRPTAEGSPVYMQVLPGSLALAALLLAFIWSSQVGWEQTVRVVSAAYHSVTAPPAEGLQSVFTSSPSTSAAASGPAPVAVGSGPRAVAAHQGLPSPSVTAAIPPSQQPSPPHLSPSPAPPATPLPTTQAGGATSPIAPAVEPLPPPATSPPEPPPATPLPLPTSLPDPSPSAALPADIPATVALP